MKKPGIILIAVLATAVTLTGVTVAAVLTEPARERAEARRRAATAQMETVELTEMQAQELAVEPTPPPAEKRNEMPAGAVEIICGDAHIACLASREEAEGVLTEYLTATAADTATERTLYAAFGADVYVVDAIGDIPLSTAAETLQKLEEDPTLVPVYMERERREITEDGETPLQTSEDASLAVGTRVVAQVGVARSVVTTTELIYAGGQVIPSGEPVSEILQEARTGIIHTGTYQAARPNGEPGEEEGAAGRTATGLSFMTPIRSAKRVKVTSNFGTRKGSMHWGIDYQAEAGSEILAPEEGVVIYCGTRGEYGFVIDIDHGNGFISRLTHCADVQVELNQRVFRGDTVATLAADADGATPHLHYEILVDGIPHNPLQYLG